MNHQGCFLTPPFFLAFIFGETTFCERYFQIFLQKQSKKRTKWWERQNSVSFGYGIFLEGCLIWTHSEDEFLSSPQKRLFKFKVFFKKKIMRFGTTLTKKIKKLKPYPELRPKVLAATAAAAAAATAAEPQPQAFYEKWKFQN